MTGSGKARLYSKSLPEMRSRKTKSELTATVTAMSSSVVSLEEPLFLMTKVTDLLFLRSNIKFIWYMAGQGREMLPLRAEVLSTRPRQHSQRRSSPGPQTPATPPRRRTLCWPAPARSCMPLHSDALLLTPLQQRLLPCWRWFDCLSRHPVAPYPHIALACCRRDAC